MTLSPRRDGGVNSFVLSVCMLKRHLKSYWLLRSPEIALRAHFAFRQHNVRNNNDNNCLAGTLLFSRSAVSRVMLPYVVTPQAD